MVIPSLSRVVPVTMTATMVLMFDDGADVRDDGNNATLFPPTTGWYH